MCQTAQSKIQGQNYCGVMVLFVFKNIYVCVNGTDINLNKFIKILSFECLFIIIILYIILIWKSLWIPKVNDENWTSSEIWFIYFLYIYIYTLFIWSLTDMGCICA